MSFHRSTTTICALYLWACQKVSAVLCHAVYLAEADAVGTPVATHTNACLVFRYDIMNFQQVGPDKYDYVQVGAWVNGHLNLTKPIQWSPQFQLKGDSPPVSICSNPCPKGQVKVSTTTITICNTSTFMKIYRKKKVLFFLNTLSFRLQFAYHSMFWSASNLLYAFTDQLTPVTVAPTHVESLALLRHTTML